MREDFRLSIDGAREGATDARQIRLSGTLDESFEATQLPKLPAGRVEVDLGNLQGLNSIGVRWWVSWLDDVEKRGTELVFARCPRPVVMQMNLINNFLGTRARVRSFMLPYFCAACDREESVLVQITELDGPPFKAPTNYCDKCDQAMEFDDLEEVYFAFMGRLAAQNRLTPPPRLASAPDSSARKGSDSLPPDDARTGQTVATGGESTRVDRKPPPAAGADGFPRPIEVAPLRPRAAVPTVPPPTAKGPPTAGPDAVTSPMSRVSPEPTPPSPLPLPLLEPLPSDRSTTLVVYIVTALCVALAAFLFWGFLLD